MSSDFNSEIRAVFLNGVQVPILDGSWNMEFGTPTREPMLGGGQVIGENERANAGTCKFSVAFRKGDTVDVYNFKRGHIRIVTNAGDSWQMKRATLSDQISFAAPDSKLELSYFGQPWEKL